MVTTHASILMYHGVTAAASIGVENYNHKHLPVTEFERHLSYLKTHCSVFSLREIVSLLNAGTVLPPNSYALTFDDTYRNVYTVALPLLEAYQLPATFFITTGFIGTNRRFWTDQVEHLVNMTHTHHVKLYQGHHCLLRDLTSLTNKRTAIFDIKCLMKSVSPKERDDLLHQLAHICSDVRDNGDWVENYENLSWDELRMMDASPLVEIGAHTVNHEILAYLDDDKLQYEITESKRALEHGLGHPIDLFSYPEGKHGHFDDRVIELMQQAGICICPSAVHGVNYPGEHPFKLKRVRAESLEKTFGVIEEVFVA
jgi:peptidoglycan/xylan/chitin deacetylase (PgdA/CDA1 family)